MKAFGTQIRWATKVARTFFEPDWKRNARLIINNYIEGAYTEEGVDLWWERKRPQLGDKTPEQVIRNAKSLKDHDLMVLFQLAESLTGQTAT